MIPVQETSSPQVPGLFRSFFTQMASRPNTCLPQHLPAPPNFFRLLSPSNLRIAAPPIRAARVSKRYQKSRIPERTQRQPPTQSVSPPLHFPGPSRMPPRNPAAAHHFDVSTFRRFHQSPQPAPGTSVATIPEGRVSPYVTFNPARPQQAPRPVSASTSRATVSQARRSPRPARHGAFPRRAAHRR